MRRWLTPLFAAAMIACAGTSTESPAAEPDSKADHEGDDGSEKADDSHEDGDDGDAVADAPDSTGDATQALMDPSKATETAPAEYKVKFETSKGDFVVSVHREWAPVGADRFYNLVKAGFYDDVRFFRVVEGFMVQFGLHGDPAVNSAWKRARIKDDKVTKSNTRGRITFATSGPNSRTTQVFINFVDRNKMLDGQGFSPFGEVTEGMDVVDSLYNGYGEGQPRGVGPAQGLIHSRGNEYLDAEYPKLDKVISARIVE